MRRCGRSRRSSAASRRSQPCATSPAGTRVCRHSSKCEKGSNEVDGGGEAGIGLVVARGDAAELFEPLEAILDEMPPLVHVGIVRDGRLAVVLGRDDGERAPLVELGTQGIVVERLVADERCELDVCDQRLDTNAVVTLAGKKNEADQIAQRICQRHDLGSQAAARAADGLIESPPFAPVACRLTLMIVPSMSAYEKSGSSDKAWKSLSNTPLSAHRRKRFHTENHFPKQSGRSRHGAPVRTTHNTPSTNRRLFSPLRPGTPFLPGRRGAIRSHWTSDRTVRIKADLHFSALNQLSLSSGIPNPMNVYRP